MAEKQTGVEELTGAYNLYRNGHASFYEEHTAEDLILLYRAYKASEWDIPPEKWEDQQVEEALKGKAPRWNEDQEPIYG